LFHNGCLTEVKRAPGQNGAINFQRNFRRGRDAAGLGLKIALLWQPLYSPFRTDKEHDMRTESFAA
jgi:hypothetical protein